MLDIISMIILLFLLMGLPMILIIIGGSKDKSDEEIEYEKQEQSKYIERYWKEKNRKKQIRKLKFRRFIKWIKNFILGSK